MKSAHYLIILLLLLAACQNDPAPSPTAVSSPVPIVATSTMSPSPTSPVASAAVPTTTPAETPTPTSTATPPPQTLTICLSRLPNDIYLYGDRSPQAQAVRHAVYDTLYNTLDFNVQPNALAAYPTVSFETITVERGSRVVNAAGELITLRSSDVVINTAGERVTLTDEVTAVEMSQMVIDSTLQPLVWSDGTAVTADDALFSYEIAADRFTPSNRALIERTAVYTSTGKLTTRWVGLPGYVHPTPHTAIWPPLPRHQLGDMPLLSLSEQRQATRQPLSTGPFVITEWSAEQIVLTRNEHYYRPNLPALDQLTFKPLPPEERPNLYTAIASGQCDVVTSDLVTLADTADPPDTATLHTSTTPIWEHIAFGINSYGFPATARPDWFQEPAVRRALTQCIDREALTTAVTNGHGLSIDSYLMPSHPLALPPSLPYDPTAANATLDELGYLDTNGDGLRQNIDSGTPFSITLTTTASDMRVQAAERIATDLANCGLQTTVSILPGPTFFANNRDGIIFDRNYDMALFAWVMGLAPNCEHYRSDFIAGPENEGFAGWHGANVTGFFNPAFDEACRAAQNAIYHSDPYSETHTAALTLFDEQRPSIPLFVRPKFALTNPNLRHFQLNPSQPSSLWNITEWELLRP